MYRLGVDEEGITGFRSPVIEFIRLAMNVEFGTIIVTEEELGIIKKE